MVADTFENLRIGNVKRVDFVHKKSSNGDFNAAYIHFNYWCDNVAACNFKDRVLNPNTEARIVYDEPWYWIVLENKRAKVKSSDRKQRINLEALSKPQVEDEIKMMTNQDFANLFKNQELESSCNQDEEDFRAFCSEISKEICCAQEDAAFITLDDVMDENRKLREQLGEYMEKAGRLEHEFNMLMDEKLCVSNELAWLKEQQVYNNV
jgi:hypothetical protein